MTRSAWRSAAATESALPIVSVRMSVSPTRGSGTSLPVEPAPERAEAARPARLRLRVGALADVDGDDRPLARAGHRLDGQVVEHAAVDEQPLPAVAHRRKDAGDGQARVDRVEQRAGAVQDDLAGDEIAAHAVEAARELLDPHVAEALGEHPPRLAAADEREHRQRVVVRRVALDEVAPEDRVDLRGAVARRDEGGDQPAHARPADAVDPHAGLQQLVVDAEVGERARAAAGEDERRRRGR